MISIQDFRDIVLAARPEPELRFTFETVGGPGVQEARWPFPGSKYKGGSVMLIHGTNELAFGMVSGDIDAWIPEAKAYDRDGLIGYPAKSWVQRGDKS
ncbi:hypothetical protein [Paraburkholderia fungorum]|uniref:hypothetical protein n=1 Tax=Paraburkholderia fungorum TaxID=134537 RepID=UPI001613E6A5|nr:hypothetical protein [Paraburkholderia fungorum]MBB5546649.1 hypothetical protein [Paraburkholderia fungorum]